MTALRQISQLLFVCLFAEQSVHSLAVVEKRHKSRDLQRVTVPPETGAACMDGSPYNFHITPGDKQFWTIHLANGNGACADEKECEELAKTAYGTSTIPIVSDSDCRCKNYNPGFGEIKSCTCVDLLYCDGSLFLGDDFGQPHQAPGGTMLHRRGRRNLQAALDLLLKEYGLDQAVSLAMTGQSSGGLSTILNIDYVANYPGIPKGIMARAIPEAGFTVDASNCCSEDSCCYREQCCYNNALVQVFDFHNMYNSVSSSCTQYYSDHPSSCLLAVHAAPFVKTPMFILNSKHDAWQLVQFAGMEFGGIYKKQAGVKESFMDAQDYGQEYEKQIRSSLEGTNHTAWVTSCICHAGCGTEGTFFDLANMPNGQWIGTTVGQWYNAPGSKPMMIDDAAPNYDCQPGGVVRAAA